jgi:hypothetical protein
MCIGNTKVDSTMPNIALKKIRAYCIPHLEPLVYKKSVRYAFFVRMQILDFKEIGTAPV